MDKPGGPRCWSVAFEVKQEELPYGYALRSFTSKPLLIVRGLLRVIFFGHGAQKVFSCFGGPGFRGIISYFKQPLGIPAAFTVLAAFTECFEEPFILDQLVARGSSDRSQTRS
jgi:DoxX-like protein